MSFASPFAWLLAAPDLRRDPNPFPRTFLAIAAVFEVLLIYPVAGSQHDFSTFLFVPAAVVSLADGFKGLRVVLDPFFARLEVGTIWTQHATELRMAWLRDSRRPANSPLLPAAARDWIICLAVIIFAVTGYPRISSGYEVRHTYNRLVVPTYFPGAERLRMRFDDAGLYHWVVANVEANCSSLVTEPFHGSFHLWTQLAPLTSMNVPAWMQILTPEEQQQIVDKLSVQLHPCVIYDPGRTEWLMTYKRPGPEPPLMRYIADHFRTQLRDYVYQLQLPPNVEHPASEYLLFRTTRFDSQPGYTVRSDIPINAGGNTFSMWFKTRGSGELLGCQDLDNLTEKPKTAVPILYVNNGGYLAAQHNTAGAALMRKIAVNDGRWRQVALVHDGGSALLYLDGSLLGGLSGTLEDSVKFCEIGDAFRTGTSGTGGYWLRLNGYVARAKLTRRALTPQEIIADYSHEAPL